MKYLRWNDSVILALLAGCLIVSTFAPRHVAAQANVLFHEGFSTDGDGTRYTLGNRGWVAGTMPNGWEHSFLLPGIEPGGPFTFPARRIAVTYSGVIAGNDYTQSAISVVDHAVSWAGSGAEGLNIALLAKDGATGTNLDPGDQFLYDRLISQGHSVNVVDANGFTSGLVSGSDLLLFSDTARIDSLYQQVDLRNVSVPVVNYNPQLADDFLLSRGDGGAAPSNQVQIRLPNSGGVPGGFNQDQIVTWTNGGSGMLPTFGVAQQGVQAIGTYRAPLATMVDKLSVVDAMIAGTAASVTHTAALGEADLYDRGTAGGIWLLDNPIPGGGGDDYAVVANGQLSVQQSGTYTFAVGGDDGGRLRIDGQDVIVDDALHGFTTRLAQVQLEPGLHNMQWVGFQRGGDAGFELSVTPEAGQTAVNLAFWDVLATSSVFDEIKLNAPLDLTAYYLDVENSPLLASQQGAILAADAGTTIDVPRGPFRTQTGAYLYAKDLNADGLPNPDQPRTLTLAPIDLTGVADPKLTLSLAGNVNAWNRDDHFRILVNGNELVSFQPDQLETLTDGSHMLTSVFKNLTYDLPDGLTQTEISIQLIAPDGDQIVGIDEIRVSDGPISGLNVFQSPIPNNFQQGINGYQGTVDTEIWQGLPDQSHPQPTSAAAIAEGLSLDPDLDTDGGIVQVLIRFEDIFGDAEGQIPLDRGIKSARLRLEAFDDGDQVELYRMLRSWGMEDSWNSLDDGIQTDGAEAQIVPEAISDTFVNFGELVFDVTESLKAFQADPDSNFGWLIKPTGTNGLSVLSSEVASETVPVADPREAIAPRLEFELEPLLELVLGDLDGDRDVDSNDLGLFIGFWTGSDYDGEPLLVTQGNLDGDRDVDSNDLGIFIGSWTGSLDAGLSSGSLVYGPQRSLPALGEVSAEVVPEPIGLAPFGLLFCAGWLRRRKPRWAASRG